MREHPILFSGPMVRAILEGRKTQTRRVAPCLLPGDKKFIHCVTHSEWIAKRAEQCPYGKPGDQLWVRETWGYCDRANVIYRADDIAALAKDRQWVSLPAWKPSIHMPRWASRITLEITNVRAERVQDISEEDAKAEGSKSIDYATVRECILNPELGSYKLHFQSLWDSINAKRGYGWNVNPWVWVISFRRIEAAERTA